MSRRVMMLKDALVATSDMKEILTLGARGEVVGFDFSGLGSEAEEIVEFIHAVAYVELLSRNLLSMADWGVRAKNTFLRNRLNTVSDVMSLDLRQINKLEGCGYKTRKEVYDTFCLFGIKLAAWMPGHYWERMKFEDAPVKE